MASLNYVLLFWIYVFFFSLHSKTVMEFFGLFTWNISYIFDRHEPFVFVSYQYIDMLHHECIGAIFEILSPYACSMRFH